MVLRNILMTVCFSAAWLAAAFSQLLTAATGTASGQPDPDIRFFAHIPFDYRAPGTRFL